MSRRANPKAIPPRIAAKLDVLTFTQQDAGEALQIAVESLLKGHGGVEAVIKYAKQFHAAQNDAYLLLQTIQDPEGARMWGSMPGTAARYRALKSGRKESGKTIAKIMRR